MGMSKEQLGSVIEVLDKKANRPCEACGVNAWTVLSQFSSFPVYDAPGIQPNTGSFLPCIIVICSNCGRTQFFNVHVLGVAKLLGFGPSEGGEEDGD